ncbi:GNAT family N-acetyltransferase [Pectinatus frisingensis]|uniref:GNAT family N-acetyltransferase n=1 Tax=Pectinatus frisingensis TaxID=865 RepID=UPI0018C50BC2|nr:GNAT family N-acetyltransferase [Pectinatus frisingensis]
MRIIEIKERTILLIDQLTEVWEKSVRTTHLFLSDSEIEDIKKYVPQALNGIAHLIVTEKDNKCPIAFMGVEEQKLEMLFITPEERGNGLGKKLIQHGIDNYSINELAVNEQNPLAKGFYEHMGFQVYKRTEHDEQGKPYPLLYMMLN